MAPYNGAHNPEIEKAGKGLDGAAVHCTKRKTRARRESRGMAWGNGQRTPLEHAATTARIF